MAYGKKYTLSAIGKSGHTFTAEIWEENYTGVVYPINTFTSPFVLECKATGDDPFQPVLPTVFSIQADMTDFTGPYPDFLTTNDRKYHVKFYAQGSTYLIWQGFILMDNLTLPFTTGRNIVNIICIDGLGLLKSCTYNFTSTNSNTGETLIQIITNCLNAIGLPDGYKVNSAINYYASAHSTATSYLRQTYIIPDTWTNNDFTYKNCYDVLENILIAHGAQLYQSNGQWWVTSVNERASDTIRVFQTDNNLSADILSTININREIKPYINDSITPFYFIENTQTKILNKCFQSIKITANIEYPENTVVNGNMTKVTGGIPDNWQRTLGTGGALTMTNVSGIYGAQITSGTTNSNIQALNCGVVSEGDIIEIKFQGRPNIVGDLQVEIKIASGSPDFYWVTSGGVNQWVSGGGYYLHKFNSTNLEPQTITTTPAPSSGALTILFRVVSTGITNVFIANLQKTGKPSLAQKSVYYNQTASNLYKKEIDIPIGGQFPLDNISQNQCLLANSTSQQLVNFTRFGKTGTFANLGILLLKQLFNIFSLTRVNMRFSQYNLFTGTGFIGLVNNMKINDPTSTISVDTFRYVFGECTFDFINNTISGTALQLSDVDVSYTLIAEPATTPPIPCANYYNDSAANWVGDYYDCSGNLQSGVTLSPSQFVCAKTSPAPFTLSGMDLTQGGNC
jgi:hypothetical protein